MKTKPDISEGAALTIYSAYPRKVGRRAAIKAIKSAVQRINRPDALKWLLLRVQMYAKAVHGRDRQFIPHPATWFNRDSFDDDPREWGDATNLTAQAQAEVAEQLRERRNAESRRAAEDAAQADAEAKATITSIPFADMMKLESEVRSPSGSHPPPNWRESRLWRMLVANEWKKRQTGDPTCPTK